MKYRICRFSFLRWMVLSGGLLLFASGGFSFLNIPAKTEAVTNRQEQTLILGRLAFTTTAFLQMGIQQRFIYTSNADASGLSTVHTASDTENPHEPAWSPDGTQIAFAGQFDIMAKNMDGPGEVNLTNTINAQQESNPSWSVTGKIAYERRPDVFSIKQIWTMNSDGSGQAQFLAISVPDESDPAWSPDGSKLAFAGLGEIWVINADGSNQRQVTMNTTTDVDPAWSPDGSRIVFGREQVGIAVINADGTNETPLTSGNDIQPTWSPDGAKIAFKRAVSGNPGIYTMDANGANQVRILADGGTFPGPSAISENPAWKPLVVLRAPADFDGDGRTDISVFRPSSGVWHLLRSTTGYWGQPWGLSNDVLAPADYDGDLKTDVAVWRPSDGNFYILNSSDNTLRVENFGLAGDIPTGGDWDGDGKADVAVFRDSGPQQGFHYRGSFGNPNGNVSSIPWGVAGDKPVAADYDGDRRTDAAIFRPSNGTWYIRQSSNGQLLAVNFGLANDKLIPADYDADAKTDIAVFRNGVWYLLRTTQGLSVIEFGLPNDIPAPADYDGDLRADPAVYRNGVWWIWKTQSTVVEGIQFGVAGDSPVPSAYVR